MSYHWHIEYEVIRILKGEFLMTIGEDEFTANAGDIIFIKGGCSTGAYRRIVCMSVSYFNLDSLMTSSPAGERLLKKVSSDSIDINNHLSAPDKELSRNHRQDVRAYEDPRGGARAHCDRSIL